MSVMPISLKDRSQRRDLRKECPYPRAFIKIKPLKQGRYYIGALLIDVSESGLGLITSLSLPIGTHIEICMDDLQAIGEVIDIDTDYEDWNWNGMIRMGVKFIDKTNWHATAAELNA